jgi:hypothetical protein
MRIDQAAAVARQQVGGTESSAQSPGFAGAGNQCIPAWLICGLTPLARTRSHQAFGIQQQNVRVDRVLAAVGTQTLGDGRLVAIRPAMNWHSMASVARNPTSAVRS